MSYGQYLKSLLPSVLTMIFLSFYTTIDGFFVSRYAGSDALAGINIVIPITCVTFGVAVMLATGAGAIIGVTSAITSPFVYAHSLAARLEAVNGVFPDAEDVSEPVEINSNGLVERYEVSAGGELIGLMPLGALLDTASYYLGLDGLTPDRILEMNC